MKVLVFVASAVMVLENGSLGVEGAPRVAYAYTTHHRPSSSGNAITSSSATNPSHRTATQPAGTTRDEFSASDYRRYMPVEDTPEVKKAREQFFTLYEKQAKLLAEAQDKNEVADDDYYYYYDDEGNEDEYEYEEEDDDDEEEDEEEDSEEGEDEDEEDDDEEEEDSEEGDDEEDSDEDEDSSSSSSSEEDYDDSSEEESGEDSSSSEEGEDSSEEDGDSSSSSSSSEEEEDGEGRGLYQPLNTNLLHNFKTVEDTPEVKLAKRKFFELYKTQAELSFNAPDHK